MVKQAKETPDPNAGSRHSCCFSQVNRRPSSDRTIRVRNAREEKVDAIKNHALRANPTDGMRQPNEQTFKVVVEVDPIRGTTDRWN